MTVDQVDRGLTDFALLVTCSGQSLMSRDHGGEKLGPLAALSQCLDREQLFSGYHDGVEVAHGMHANLVDRS